MAWSSALRLCGETVRLVVKASHPSSRIRAAARASEKRKHRAQRAPPSLHSSKPSATASCQAVWSGASSTKRMPSARANASAAALRRRYSSCG